MTKLIESELGVNVGVDIGNLTLDICIHEKQLWWQEEIQLPG
jgi:hypothetical protein